MSESVVAIRRYPVKCMAGEHVVRVELDARGLSGDRWFAVEDLDGHFASGKNTRRFRRHDEVFGYHARATDEGVEVSFGSLRWLVGDPDLDAHLSDLLGEQVTVKPEGTVRHFDVGSVSLISTATLDWCEAELGVDADSRRLRPNLVVQATEPFIEERWIGSLLRVGTAELRVNARTERCRTIDIAQDGAAALRRWLKPLAATRDMQVGVYAQVVVPGAVAVGDRIEAADRTASIASGSGRGV